MNQRNLTKYERNLENLTPRALKDRQASLTLITFLKTGVDKFWLKQIVPPDFQKVMAVFLAHEKSKKRLIHFDSAHKRVLVDVINKSPDLLAKIKEKKLEDIFKEFSANQHINLWKLTEILQNKTSYDDEDLSVYHLRQDNVLRPLLTKLVEKFDWAIIASKIGVDPYTITQYLKRQIRAKTELILIPEHALFPLLDYVKSQGWYMHSDKEIVKLYDDFKKYLDDNPQLKAAEKRRKSDKPPQPAIKKFKLNLANLDQQANPAVNSEVPAYFQPTFFYPPNMELPADSFQLNSLPPAEIGDVLQDNGIAERDDHPVDFNPDNFFDFTSTEQPFSPTLFSPSTLQPPIIPPPILDLNGEPVVNELTAIPLSSLDDDPTFTLPDFLEEESKLNADLDDEQFENIWKFLK